MSLIHLIYVSTAREELDVVQLDKILESSVRHNTEQGVTGMLLYANGNFMQVLEGDAAAVDETFSRVKDDPRHHGVFLIERAPIAQRAFARWTMGFKRLDAQDMATHPDYAPFFSPGFDAASIGAQSGVALEILLDFARSYASGFRRRPAESTSLTPGNSSPRGAIR